MTSKFDLQEGCRIFKVNSLRDVDGLVWISITLVSYTVIINIICNWTVNSVRCCNDGDSISINYRRNICIFCLQNQFHSQRLRTRQTGEILIFIYLRGNQSWSIKVGSSIDFNILESLIKEGNFSTINTSSRNCSNSSIESGISWRHIFNVWSDSFKLSVLCGLDSCTTR